MQIIETRTTKLLVTLEPEELRAVSLEMADTFHAMGTEAEEQKNVKDQMKARLSELQARLTRLSLVVRNGSEYRDVEVEVQRADLGFIQEVRTDTGEVIATRPPTDRERQLHLASAEEEK